MVEQLVANQLTGVRFPLAAQNEKSILYGCFSRLVNWSDVSAIHNAETARSG